MSMSTQYCDDCGSLWDPEDGDCDGCKQQNKINKMKDALKFYADSKNWKSYDIYEWSSGLGFQSHDHVKIYDDGSCSEYTGGNKAKECLKELFGE